VVPDPGGGRHRFAHDRPPGQAWVLPDLLLWARWLAIECPADMPIPSGVADRRPSAPCARSGSSAVTARGYRSLLGLSGQMSKRMAPGPGRYQNVT